MERINVAKLLEDCPKGMELNCTMFNDVVFNTVEFGKTIIVARTNGTHIHLDKYGTYFNDKDAKCVIFPKGKTTWEGFVPPYQFKDGDILFVDCSDDDDKGHQYIFILNRIYNGEVHSYCHYRMCGVFHPRTEYLTGDEFPIRLATEEEKRELFDAIKANGYKWNAEHKTLEKLIEPKFKVGDKIRHKESGIHCTLGEYSEGISAYRTNIGLALTFKDLEQWELAPNKFDINTLKPFAKVLVRNHEKNEWQPNFFNKYCKEINSFKLIGVCTPAYANREHFVNYCIPYEGNEHLSGKTDDCDEFYKTWK